MKAICHFTDERRKKSLRFVPLADQCREKTLLLVGVALCSPTIRHFTDECRKRVCALFSNHSPCCRSVSRKDVALCSTCVAWFHCLQPCVYPLLSQALFILLCIRYKSSPAVLSLCVSVHVCLSVPLSMCFVFSFFLLLSLCVSVTVRLSVPLSLVFLALPIYVRLSLYPRTRILHLYFNRVCLFPFSFVFSVAECVPAAGGRLARGL